MKCVDGNGNRISVTPTMLTVGGLPLVVARLLDDPSRGYLALDEGTCVYRTACPRMGWFGVGERYPDAESALSALAVSFI